MFVDGFCNVWLQLAAVTLGFLSYYIYRQKIYLLREERIFSNCIRVWYSLWQEIDRRKRSISIFMKCKWDVILPISFVLFTNIYCICYLAHTYCYTFNTYRYYVKINSPFIVLCEKHFVRIYGLNCGHSVMWRWWFRVQKWTSETIKQWQ